MLDIAAPVLPASSREDHDRPRAGTGPIVVLTGGGPLPWCIINAVVERFGPVTVLEETPESMRVLFRRRLKKLGWVEVMGQIAFGLLQRILARVSRERVRARIGELGLNPEPSLVCPRIPVGSVNAEACRAVLRRLEPGLVLVIGTRMIGPETLAAVPAPFINYHAGINPKYRGMCGGYWSLASGEPENFGPTVHLVDRGVDTGGILEWSVARTSPGDTFVSYPLVLAAAARPLVIRAIENLRAGAARPVARDLASRQWYHPTLWRYLWTGLTRGVW